MNKKHILKEAGVLTIGVLLICASVAVMGTTNDATIATPKSEINTSIKNSLPCALQDNVILWDNFVLTWNIAYHSQDDHQTNQNNGIPLLQMTSCSRKKPQSTGYSGKSIMGNVNLQKEVKIIITIGILPSSKMMARVTAPELFMKDQLPLQMRILIKPCPHCAVAAPIQEFGPA